MTILGVLIFDIGSIFWIRIDRLINRDLESLVVRDIAVSGIYEESPTKLLRRL